MPTEQNYSELKIKNIQYDMTILDIRTRQYQIRCVCDLANAAVLVLLPLFQMLVFISRGAQSLNVILGAIVL